MKVTLEFAESGREADVDGERHSRLYRVVRVDWALSPDGGGHVQVHLSFLAHA